jgi:hypothetical protein
MNPTDRRRIHGPLIPSDEASAEARKELISWGLLLASGVLFGALLCLAFAYAAGPVPA